MTPSFILEIAFDIAVENTIVSIVLKMGWGSLSQGLVLGQGASRGLGAVETQPGQQDQAKTCSCPWALPWAAVPFPKGHCLK